MATAEGAVLIVAVDRRELEGVRARCSGLERLELDLRFAAQGSLGGRRVVLAAEGPGPRLAARAVERAWKAGPFSAMVSTGTCGALDTALRPGDIFVATAVRCPENNAVLPARVPAVAL
ncbi:MAG: hypothetical protein ACPL88_01595, partial [Bryobacteraceae bacterium]